MRIACLLILFAAALADCAEQTPRLPWGDTKPVAFPSDGCERQMQELARQLGVRVLIDTGKLYSDPGSEEDTPSFSSDKASMAELLDDYCRSRDFIWRYWAEANAICFEPREEAMRTARELLDRRLAEWPLERIGGASILASERVEEEWRKAAVANDKIEVVIVDGFSGQWLHRRLPNPRKASSNLIFAGIGRSPDNLRAYIATWLKSTPLGVISLRQIENHDGTVDILVLLGTSTDDVNAVSTDELLERAVAAAKEQKPGAQDWYRGCELYRRSKFEWASVRASVERSNLFNHLFDGQQKGLENAWWDIFRAEPAKACELVFDWLRKADGPTQLRVVKSKLLPNPIFHGSVVLPQWETLLDSANADIVEEAKAQIETYGQMVKEREMRVVWPENLRR